MPPPPLSPPLSQVDADHLYEGAFADIDTCLKLFPKAVIAGDDWAYKAVERAARECAEKYGKTIAVESRVVWTYAPGIKKTSKTEIIRYGGREGTKEQRRTEKQLCVCVCVCVCMSVLFVLCCSKIRPRV